MKQYYVIIIFALLVIAIIFWLMQKVPSVTNWTAFPQTPYVVGNPNNAVPYTGQLSGLKNFVASLPQAISSCSVCTTISNYIAGVVPSTSSSSTTAGQS